MIHIGTQLQKVFRNVEFLEVSCLDEQISSIERFDLIHIASVLNKIFHISKVATDNLKFQIEDEQSRHKPLGNQEPRRFAALPVCEPKIDRTDLARDQNR